MRSIQCAIAATAIAATRIAATRIAVVIVVCATAQIRPGIHAASADDRMQPVKLGDKTMELTTTAAMRTRATIDGKVVAENAFVEVKTAFSDGSRGAAVLLVSDGGNGCPGNYLVVSVNDSGVVNATDPFGTCSDTAIASNANDTLTVRFAPTGGRDGSSYHWSFDKGLEGPVAEPFRPKAGTNWANAGDLLGKYPWEAMDNADVYAAFKTLLGDDFPTFTNYFGKGDQMDATDDGIIVGDCWDDSAEESAAVLIGIDPAKHTVYVALQDGDEDPRLYPDKSLWPASLQERLKQWP
jgi:hypothetical protein